MATHSPHEKIRGSLSVSPTVEIEAPINETPQEIDQWLMRMGWQRVDDGGVYHYYRTDGSFDGLYMPWCEAVACEQARFMSLGNVGEKKTLRMDEAMSSSEAAAIGGE
jgi:hypothetical protein